MSSLASHRRAFKPYFTCICYFPKPFVFYQIKSFDFWPLRWKIERVTKLLLLFVGFLVFFFPEIAITDSSKKNIFIGDFRAKIFCLATQQQENPQVGLMPHSAMYFTNIARDSSCTKEFPIKKKNPNPRQRIKEMKARCSNFNNRELCGRKIKDSLRLL